MVKRETLLQKRIDLELNANPRIKCIKTHGSPYTEIGTPDLMGCYDGRLFVFEVKRPDVDKDGNFIEKPSNIQLKRLDEWHAVGAIAGVVRSIDDAFKLFGLYEEGEVLDIYKNFPTWEELDLKD